MELTVITPVHPAHVEKLQIAADSVKRQSIRCQHLIMVDEMLRGPGWVRNRLLQRVKTEYVTFLDADDWLEPTFAEDCLAILRPGKYVYTDWYQDNNIVAAPDRPWCNGTWHCVTAVMHTRDALGIGGFDENLAAMEDTDFYLKLNTRLICGIRLAKPLFHYAANGGRSQAVHDSGEIDTIKDTIGERYKNEQGCCGIEAMDFTQPVNAHTPGMVLAMALWGGNRHLTGAVTGTRYPRMSKPMLAWIDPRDAAVMQNVFKVLDTPDKPQPITDANGNAQRGVAAFANVVIKSGLLGEPVKVAAHGEYTPNFERVVEIAKMRLDD